MLILESAEYQLITTSHVVLYTQVPEKKKSYREIREEQLAKERAEKAAQEAEEVGNMQLEFIIIKNLSENSSLL